jgi:entericidin B
MTRVVYPAIAIFFALAPAACNTIGGVGEDVEAGGEAISDTAQEAEQELSN